MPSIARAVRWFAAAAVAAGPVAAQLTWTTVPFGTMPSPRSGHSIVQEAGLNELWLFGGRDASGARNDLWRRDLVGWQHLVTSLAPPPRSHAVMASIGTSAFLFGGRDSSGAALGDTWQFFGGGWSPVAVPGPAAREGAAMAFGPGFASTSFELVLFGGADGSQVFGDLWTFADFQWTQRALPLQPVARYGHTMAFYNDAGQRRVLLFGGIAANGAFLDDTWLLASAGSQPAWTHFASATRPPARAEHTMRYATHRGRMQVHGGRDATTVFGDLWEWDGADWTQVGTNAGPSARFGAVLVDGLGNPNNAPYAGELYGGTDAQGLRSDGWQLTSTHAPSHVAFGPLPTLQSTISGSTANAGAPWLDDTFSFQLSAPSGQLLLPHLIVGFSDSISPLGPLPLQLAAFDNQTLLVSPDLLFAMPGPGSFSVLPVAVPNLPALAGTHAYLQGIAYFVPSLGPARWAVSMGHDCVLGLR